MPTTEPIAPPEKPKEQPAPLPQAPPKPRPAPEPFEPSWPKTRPLPEPKARGHP